MERLAEEIARVARELQRDVEGLRLEPAWSNGLAESTDSAKRLVRIEQRLEAVQADTGELVRRVPGNLGALLVEMKRLLLLRLTASVDANESLDSQEAADDPNHAVPTPSTIVKALTSQEQRVFELCFQCGFLSYREIAEHLDITPSAAKNLVNRMLQSDRKRPLFAKRYKHGAASVGIRPDLEERILKGRGSEKERRHGGTSTIFSAG